MMMMMKTTILIE